MKILIVDDNEMTRDLLEMYLESYFDLSPVIAISGNEAIKLLENGLEVETILSDFNMPDGTGGDLFKYYQEKKIDSHFALITAEPFEILEEFKIIERTERFYFLQKPYSGDQFVETLNPAISIGNDGKEEVKKPEFMKVKIHKFLKYINASVDVYLKLSEKKLVKVSNRIDKASSDQLNRYVEKGADYIYLTKDDFKIFVDSGMDEANTKMKKSTGVKLINAQKDAVESIQDTMVYFGINSKAIETADNCFKATLKSLSKKDGLKDLLPSFNKGDENFKYNLSVACSYFSVAMGQKVDFCDSKNLEKLAMAALFQDISIEEPKLVKITSTDSQDFMDLGRNDQKLVLDHPQNSISILDKHVDISIDVKNIILQHHERPDQTGFPRNLSVASIAPLSCIFIMAHELSNRVLSTDTIESNLGLIKANFETRYNKGNFKKVFDSFSKVFTKL